MKTEARLFMGISAFFWAAAIAYGFWSFFYQNHVEVVGVVALVLSGGLAFIPGSFFMFVSRRIDPRPEDRRDAEIAEGAGEIGFFAPGSYWPAGLAGAAAVLALGFAFVQMWLVIVGILLLLYMIGGLVFEYYIGGNKRRSP